MTKALGLPEVQPFSLAHEFLGARLARLFGLRAPRVEAIVISPAFLDATAGDLADARLRLSPGLAVGTEFIGDLLPFAVPVRLIEDEAAEAAAIYVFDALTQNPDRSIASPNCGRAARRVVPYDFETAFSFRLAIPRGDPWRVGGLPFLRTHLFHEVLRRSDVDWQPVFGRFRAVPLAAVTDVCSTIPDAWAEVAHDVRTHIAAVLDHWLQFEQEITISLGKAR